MSNLKITEVVIEDSLGQLAKTCTITLASEEAATPAVAEFGFPGDEPTAGATDIRPNGTFIDIVGTYGGVPSHVLFKGSIEYMDDLEDPDQLSYKITLSQVPRGFPHKQKRSAVWNMSEKGEDLGWNAVSSNSVLHSICGKAGVTLGRCDIPSYNIWGTYEVIQQSPIEVAQSLVAPFNQFEFEKYYVRMDMNGLQVIKVNYADAAGLGSGRAYSMTHALSRQSSYQIYIPDKSSDGDVLLTGGDKYFNTATGLGHWVVDAIHTYEENSASRMPNIEERYTEKTTDVRFTVELSYEDESVSEGQTQISFPAIPADGDDIDSIIESVKDGDYTSVTIIDSLPWHIVERNYGPIRGSTTLIMEKETFVEYEKKIFKGDGSVDTSFMETERNVPTFDETIENHWCTDGQAPTHMTRNWYYYDNVGNGVCTVTANYYYCRGWNLQKVDVQSGDNVGVTNSMIQFYLNAWNSYNNPPDQMPLPKKGTRISTSKTPMCRYQLLNGERLLPLFIPKRQGHSSYSVDEEYLKAIGRSRAALQIGCPGMDYGGLDKVWAQVQKGFGYQTGGYYWHTVVGTYSLDTTPVVGESIGLGITGICESFKHTINADEAITSVTVRRLTKR
jgi:hypothetical protein